MNLSEHPTVRHFHDRTTKAQVDDPEPSLDAGWLRQLCLDCGADDAGLVDIDRPALDDERDDILQFFPRTRTLLPELTNPTCAALSGTITNTCWNTAPQCSPGMVSPSPAPLLARMANW